MKYVITRKAGPFWRRSTVKHEFDSLEALEQHLEQFGNRPFGYDQEYKIVIKRIGAKADELLDMATE